MDHLWAPWRLSYIANARSAEQGDVCFICKGLAETSDKQNQIVLRTPNCAVLLNRFPYNNGHLLVAPNAHKGELDELEPAEMLELQEAIRRMTSLIKKLMNADGFNIGLNLGRVAGAGLPGHLHWHVVPRWHGDANFMPAISDTKVISQSLEALYELLTANLK